MTDTERNPYIENTSWGGKLVVSLAMFAGSFWLPWFGLDALFGHDAAVFGLAAWAVLCLGGGFFDW